MPSAWETMLGHQLEHSQLPLTRHRLLLAHLDYAWDRARPRMSGLTNDEYFWEPVPRCWTVRARADGSFMPDWASPEPSPAPFTTIAWRMAHIGFFLHLRANHRFGDRSLTPMNAAWPGSADDAIAWIDEGFRAYREGVAALADADLDIAPGSPSGHIDTRFPLAMNIQHITLELIHHGAEVSLLRDLYRTRGDGQDSQGSRQLA